MRASHWRPCTASRALAAEPDEAALAAGHGCGPVERRAVGPVRRRRGRASPTHWYYGGERQVQGDYDGPITYVQTLVDDDGLDHAQVQYRRRGTRQLQRQ